MNITHVHLHVHVYTYSLVDESPVHNESHVHIHWLMSHWLSLVIDPLPLHHNDDVSVGISRHYN